MENVKEVQMKESEKLQQLYSRVCHDAGNINYQIRKLQGDLESLMVKAHNTAIDFEKAKTAETKAQLSEATPDASHPV